MVFVAPAYVLVEFLGYGLLIVLVSFYNSSLCVWVLFGLVTGLVDCLILCCGVGLGDFCVWLWLFGLVVCCFILL